MLSCLARLSSPSKGRPQILPWARGWKQQTQQEGHAQASTLGSNHPGQGRREERNFKCVHPAPSSLLADKTWATAVEARPQHSGSKNDGVALNCLYSKAWEVLATKREQRGCWQPNGRLERKPPPT